MSTECIEFKVVFDVKMGDMVKLMEALAKSGVNLSTIALEKGGNIISLRFYPSDVEKARASLKEIGIQATEKEVLLVEAEDRLGQYAAIARKLTHAHVEILASHLLTRKKEKMHLIFEVDNIDIAKDVLKDQLVRVEG